MLIRGGWTLVDVEDFPLLCRYVWRIAKVSRLKYPRPVTTLDGQMVYLHRFLMAPLPSFLVDHVNRDPNDNRRKNLRIVTYLENNLNRPGNSSSTSGFKGVAWTNKWAKWTVFVGPKSARRFLGAFDCELEAARAYNAWAKEHFGPFAYLNPV